MRVTDPAHAIELRDEGLCLYALDRHREAADALAEYLNMVRLEVLSLVLRWKRRFDG